MPTESGDMKLLGNFRKLIDHVSGETTYNSRRLHYSIVLDDHTE